MAQIDPVPLVEDNPSKPYKAYMGSLLTGVGVFVAAWISDDDPFTKKEAASAALAAVAALVPGFGLVFAVSNPKRRKR